MGRRREGVLIRSCFPPEHGAFACSFCKSTFLRDHLGNFKSHLHKKHKRTFDMLQQQEEQQQMQERELNNDPANKKIKISLELSENDVRDICANFVVGCGVALTFFNTKNFDRLFNPICAQMNMHKINRNNIGEIVTANFCNELSNLKALLANKIISIKIDSARRLSRSVVCLNAQYLENGKIEIKTLAIQNVLEKHTAPNLKAFILESLQRYDIGLDQVYSITSDNGTNMIACGNLLQQDTMEEVEIYLPESWEVNENEIFENCDTIFEDAITFDTYISENLSSLVVLRCAAHTIQLSLNDVLKNVRVSDCFADCKNVVKKLRTPTFQRLTALQNFLPPLADCPTRWSYSYELLKRLQNLKSFVEENIKDAKIDWDFVEEFLFSFDIVKQTTEKLQNHNLLFGDFIQIYLEMILIVKKESNESDMSKLLLQSLTCRKQKLLQNPTVAAAIYIDPRLRPLMQSPEFISLKPIAIAHLKALHLKMNKYNETYLEPSITNISDQLCLENTNNLLSALLKQIRQSEPSHANAVEAFAIIENFNENCELEMNLAEYWEAKKYLQKTMYDLYKIIHAAPATQVSVERAFSTLKYIINDYRSTLNDDLTEAILILRLNSKY